MDICCTGCDALKAFMNFSVRQGTSKLPLAKTVGRTVEICKYGLF